MIAVVAIGVFLVAMVLATVIYLPVLKWNGVEQKLLLRSLTMGAIGSLVLVLSSMAFSFVSHFSLVSFVSVPGLVASILVSGHVLRKNLSLRAWTAYAIAGGVLCLSGFILFILFLVFLTQR